MLFPLADFPDADAPSMRGMRTEDQDRMADATC
jgi:hypothetical protein